MAVPDFVKHTIDQFHAQHGRGVPPWGDNLLLLTTTGAKSGEKHTTPVVQRAKDGYFVIVASKGGRPGDPQWYRNLQANPEVDFEVAGENGTEHYHAKARPVPSGPERDELYAYMAEVWPGFWDYEKNTTRTIPVVVLEPTPK